MADLKHTFTQGRMNKDLDERVVPNGEYRDAMNVQVASSESSEIGTIQNILGNVAVEGYLEGLYPSSAICLATIADEKNDSLYFFIQDKNRLEDIDINLSHSFVIRDMIIEYKPSVYYNNGYC